MVKVLRNYLPAISERGDQWIRNINVFVSSWFYLSFLSGNTGISLHRYSLVLILLHKGTLFIFLIAESFPLIVIIDVLGCGKLLQFSIS